MHPAPLSLVSSSESGLLSSSPCRALPPFSHSAPACRHNGQGPLAVQAGLIPAQAQDDKGKGKKVHRGGALGDARHLQLCPVWVVKGLASCGDPRCPHAHSDEELRARKAEANQ